MSGYPWPKAPQADGTGTSSEDLQRIVGAQYSTPGILPTGGCEVEGTSGMAYKITAGAVILKTGSGLGLLYPVEEQTVSTAPAPSTGSRTDRVVMNSEGTVHVTQGPTPAGGITLRSFLVLAGTTATTAAQRSVDRTYAIPAGASLGLLHQFHDPSYTPAPTEEKTMGAGRFTLPADRIIEIKATHSGAAIEGGSNPRRTLRWKVFVDDEHVTTFLTNDYSPTMYPQTTHFSYRMTLPDGAHRIHYIQDVPYGGAFYIYKGGPDRWPGNRFEVWDMGVAE